MITSIVYSTIELHYNRLSFDGPQEVCWCLWPVSSIRHLYTSDWTKAWVIVLVMPPPFLKSKICLLRYPQQSGLKGSEVVSNYVTEISPELQSSSFKISFLELQGRNTFLGPSFLLLGSCPSAALAGRSQTSPEVNMHSKGHVKQQPSEDTGVSRSKIGSTTIRMSMACMQFLMVLPTTY